MGSGGGDGGLGGMGEVCAIREVTDGGHLKSVMQSGSFSSLAVAGPSTGWERRAEGGVEWGHRGYFQSRDPPFTLPPSHSRRFVRIFPGRRRRISLFHFLVD